MDRTAGIVGLLNLDNGVLTPIATGGLNLGYVVGGGAAAPNQSGVRSFCSVEDGVIRFLATSATPVTTEAACLAYKALQ